jgi:SNF2 family DNA or RNA helicase
MEPYLFDSVVFREHQINGIRKLMRMKSFLLADEMGLGKSLQALTVFVGDVMTGQGNIALVVCPVTLRANWADEIEKFSRIRYMLLGEEVNPSTGKSRILTPMERTVQIVEFFSWSGPKILILNYEQVEPHLDELNVLQARVAIFDEAHYIKNPDSKRTKAALGLKAERNFLLTGTPVLNQVNELWSLLNKIAPQHFKNYYAFRNRYCVFGGYKNKQITGVKNQKELQNILEQVMVRRLKKDVLTLPQPYYVQHIVDLHPTQRKLYDQAEEELQIDSIDPNAPPHELENALVKFLRLKQICGTPATLGHPDDSYKLDAVVDRAKIDIASGEKIVIFTQFREVLAVTAKRLENEGISVTQLHGGIDKRERVPLVREWCNTPSPSVLLCMTQVAVGFNATASRVCYFIDKLFVPGLNNQAIDRLHRIGQQEAQPVLVVEFIAKQTVESRVEKILRDKKKIFDNVIEGAGIISKLLQALREVE